MTNKIILSLLAVILLGSCANKFSLAKRKYTKGYYFASSKNTSAGKKENEHKGVVAKQLNKKNTIIPVETSSAIEIKDQPLVVNKNTEQVIVKNTASKRSLAPVTASAKSKEHFFFKPAVKAVSQKQNISNINDKKGSSDTNLIIMIILCLFPFINLIPVYLHDGKKLTLNFLITLILDFTWVLGVVYALLVILDVVDLA